MSYRLDPATRVSDGLRGVSFAELDLAHTALGSPPERHSGVHSARKCLKRLRSLLLLARPGIPDPVFLSLTDRIAGIARGLAAARDAQALTDAVDKLARETESGPGDGPIQSLRGWLQKRRHAAEQNLEQSAASEAMRALLELRPRFAGLAVYPDDFSPLAEGLRRCYREARHSAIASPPTAPRTCINGARGCSIIGGRCSYSPRAGRRSFPRGSRRRGPCHNSSAMTTTSRSSRSSSPRLP